MIILSTELAQAEARRDLLFPPMTDEQMNDICDAEDERVRRRKMYLKALRGIRKNSGTRPESEHGGKL